MRVIVTGGAGFIGSALVRHLVLERHCEVLTVDALTYAGCEASLKAVAGKQGLKVPAETTVTATIGIGPRSEGGFGLTAELSIHLPGMARDDAQRLIDAAHQVCPYSNATRGNVDVGLTIV